jgi:hypothetical protein
MRSSNRAIVQGSLTSSVPLLWPSRGFPRLDEEIALPDSTIRITSAASFRRKCTFRPFFFYEWNVCRGMVPTHRIPHVKSCVRLSRAPSLPFHTRTEGNDPNEAHREAPIVAPRPMPLIRTAFVKVQSGRSKHYFFGPSDEITADCPRKLARNLNGPA